MHYIPKWLIILVLALVFLSCSSDKENPASLPELNKTAIIKDSIKQDSLWKPIDSIPISYCEWDDYLQNFGLVDIQEVDSSIMVELKYSTVDNFMEKDVYGCLEKCYLQPDVAEKLKIAQSYLTENDSCLSLLVYDGVRPRSIQQYMWDLVDLPLEEKTKFVSNPKNGSLHNFGAAVDITIADIHTKEALDMGVPYDFIGLEAWPTKEKEMLEKGALTKQQVENRRLLRKAMRAGGFFNIQSEWWHFNSCRRDSAKVWYSIVEGMENIPED